MPQRYRRLVETSHSLVSSDSAFQRRARLMQSLWREERGYPIGEHRGVPLGSRLAMPWAEETLANYLTDTICNVVRTEALIPGRDPDRLFGYPRIVNDLLSSQPLCFNLFSELQQNLALASLVFADLTFGRTNRVTQIAFEYSPGRRDLCYTADASAFDVYMEYLTPAGAAGFFGIEVKYHESLQNSAARHRSRYDEVAAAMRCFRGDALESLREKPLQQIWRDHLLAGSILQHGNRFSEGCFVFLYPKDNLHCSQAVQAYRQCLTSYDTFMVWTLEKVYETLKQHTDAGWVTAFFDRYLDFSRVDRLIAG
jgi:mRNA-degrading endonuclease YafQ of YafQ-DinJ toxin-antitoxin module